MVNKKIDARIIRRLEDWVERISNPDEKYLGTPYGGYSPRGVLDEVKKDPPTEQSFEFARIFGDVLKPERKSSLRRIYTNIVEFIECIPIIYEDVMKNMRSPKKK